MNKKLHADAAGKESLIGRLAHFEQELDPVVLLLPGQYVGITLNNDDVDQVETLLIVL